MGIESEAGFRDRSTKNCKNSGAACYSALDSPNWRCRRWASDHFKLLPLILALSGCSQESVDKADIASPPIEREITKTEVKAFCGDCHAYADPETFPKHYWAKEVENGFGFYKDSGRKDLLVPDFQQVVRYYEKRAPAKFDFAPVREDTHGPLRFYRSGLKLPNDLPFPAVSFIHHAHTPGAAGVWFCDMHKGRLVHCNPTPEGTQIVTSIDTGGFPAHIEICDLDQNGTNDLLVADLGSFMPGDHQNGRVLWARADDNGGKHDLKTLFGNLGRVADARPLDADADGDIDLIVGEFGWRETGSILMLENIAGERGEPRYQRHLLDERHGTSHIEVCDLNGDNAPDFVALISQEFETIVAFINTGNGQFRKRTIFEAHDPSFGSTGIQLVDLDSDGDIDILYTNGDMLDSGILKPSHGVQMLKNNGDMNFTIECLTEMPGAYKAVAADLDRDGDLDVVACAFFFAPRIDASSLIWLEQQADHNFVRHNLEGADQQFCTLEVGDFDKNGTADIATGNFYNKPTVGRDWLSFWWNPDPLSSEK